MKKKFLFVLLILCASAKQSHGFVPMENIITGPSVTINNKTISKITLIVTFEIDGQYQGNPGKYKFRSPPFLCAGDACIISTYSLMHIPYFARTDNKLEKPETQNAQLSLQSLDGSIRKRVPFDPRSKYLFKIETDGTVTGGQQ